MIAGNATGVIRVGFLGAGYIADWHANALKSVPGVALVGVCDKDGARAEAFARRHGGLRAYDNLDAMLADREAAVAAVHVLLPPDLHGKPALELIDRGIQVLLEKPMAVSLEECDEIVARAAGRGVRVGVGHNFLFSPVYERLRADLKGGRLGRPDRVAITWHRGLDQLQSGPFDLWMLRDPRNILLEIGPHCLTPVLDLLGPLQVSSVRPSGRLELPGGRSFYRRWSIEGEAGPAAVSLSLSFSPGFTEQQVAVRGSLAGATADFERNTYVLHQHTAYGMDVDRYTMIRQEARSLSRQARGTFGRYALSKLKLSKEGSPYGQSIARALKTFYAGTGPAVDPRISAEMGRDAVRLGLEIGAMGVAAVPAPEGRLGAVGSTVEAPASGTPAEILLLGATGFIGQELARQLVAGGRRIRILARSPGKLPTDLTGPQVEVVRGDLNRPGDLERALDGCRVVYHLARGNAKTWEEWQQQDVEVTRKVAEACLTAGVGRLIYTGTIDSYYAGAKAGTINEATGLDPQIARRNLYARAKAASEDLLLQMHRDRKLPVVIFRPGIVVGRGGSPLHWGIGMWSWNAVCRVWGRGDHPLPFVLVQDVAKALIAGLDAPGIEGEDFNLVAETSLSANDYLRALEEHAQVTFQKSHTPPWKFYVADLGKWAVKQLVRHPDRRRPSYRDWETRTQRAYYDCAKARKLLGWNPVSDRDEFVRLGIQEPCAEFLA